MFIGHPALTSYILFRLKYILNLAQKDFLDAPLNLYQQFTKQYNYFTKINKKSIYLLKNLNFILNRIY